MSIHKETTGAGLHEPSQYRVENITGSTIPILTAVKRTNGYGIFVQITPVTDTADITWGVTMGAITTGTDGYIARNGNFGGLDTSAWSVGTSLYKTATGVITSTVAGDSVGLVLVQDATAGRILFTLGEGSGGGGGGAVDSVFGRAGVVSANTNDYTWAQVDKTTSDLADLTTKSHTSLTDTGSNTHAQIDTHLASTSNPHTVTASDVGLGNVTNESKATMFTAPAFTGNSSFAGNGSPTLGHVPTGTDGVGNWTWQAPSGGGGGAVDSVYGRTGAVIANANDYTWAQVNKTVSNISDITTRSHTSLTDVGTKSHATLDSEVGTNTTHSALTSGNPHSVTATELSLGNVTNESKATMFTNSTLTGSAIFSGNGTPAAGKVPSSTDGTGAWTWEDPSASFPITADPTLVADNYLDNTTGVNNFVFGEPQFNRVAGTYIALKYHGVKGALRCGQSSANVNDEASIGSYSFACGRNAKANGDSTMVYGNSNVASGNYSFSGGQNSEVISGSYSVAIGYNNLVTGQNSFSLGSGLSVSAAGTFGIGIGNVNARATWTCTQADCMVIMGGPVGIGTLTPAAKVEIVQENATGAIPVITLEQVDVSEEIIEITSTAGTGNAVEAVGGKSLTTTLFIKCTVNGATVYIPAGTIT